MADMGLKIKVDGLRQVQGALQQLGSGGVRKVVAAALNEVAKDAQFALQRHIQTVFDRPTKFIATSPKRTQATPNHLQVVVAPTAGRADRLPTTGGKVGVDPQHVLQAQEFGGRRADKRSEVRLRRIGVLPAGFQVVIPANPFPGSEDGHGNLKQGFVVQVLSYVQAFGEQGYRANMSAATKAKVHRNGNQRRIRTTNGPFIGRRYFVSYGKHRGAPRKTAKGDLDQRTGHLAPGIWAVVGRSGADVRPVMLFVRRGNYKPRLNMQQLVQSMNVPERMDRAIRRNTYLALEAAGLR